MSDLEPNSLQRSLAQLHAELAGAPRLDEKSRQMLREGGPTPAAQASPHRLEGLAVGFEADHPALAASLREFIDLLGRAGL